MMMTYNEIMLPSQSQLLLNPPETIPFYTGYVVVGPDCILTSSLLKLHSINDRSFNLYVAGEAINLSSDFPLPPHRKIQFALQKFVWK